MDYTSYVARACRLSRFARLLATQSSQNELHEGLERPFSRQEMVHFLESRNIDSEQVLAACLRQLRKKIMWRIIVRDLNELADLAEVTSTMTNLAELSVQFALNFLSLSMRAQYGEAIGAESATPQPLFIVAMGKLGGEELNVSSDIDLVALYGEDGETSGPTIISNHEYFTRLTRKLIATLNELTEEGFVFRVDMRLRPYGESGPLVCSLGMFENYLITQGREWERYAWIKSRVISPSDGNEVAALVRPFVFRRHLDFGAFASLRDLHAQIRQQVMRRDIQDDIKLGPGGIREIEFIVQVFQLIRGGRDVGLRVRATLDALHELEQRKLLEATAAQDLRSAYLFLRNLEHRLQYLDDQQTQRLPRASEDRNLIAEAMGFLDYQSFFTALDMHRARVGNHFEHVFTNDEQGETHSCASIWHADENDEIAINQLTKLSYREPSNIQHRLHAMRFGSRYRQMSASTQSCLDKLVPRVIEIASGFPNADDTLYRILDLLEGISRRESYFALLLEYPHALEHVAKLVSASPWAAHYISQHPILLDELLSIEQLYSAPDWSALTHHLHKQLQEAHDDTERQMGILRNFKHTQTIRLLAQDLAGILSLETLSDHLSDLAFLILREVLQLCWSALRSRHVDMPHFAIIGYGKLGGKELGYASDLDMIFLYDDDAPEAPENYARLAQRINTWLTSMTPDGVLYDTDLRLRPNGASGLLVSPIDSFAEYQAQHAWTWEHQALTRARFAAGEQTIGTKFEEIKINVLRKHRDLATLRQDILAMRTKMLDAHPNPSNLFDIKHDRGGIIDVEFIVQYLVLGYSHQYLELTGNIGNLALLKLAAKLDLIDQELAMAVHDAYRHFRRLQHSLRLQGETYARIEPTIVKNEVEAVLALWQRIFPDIDGDGLQKALHESH